MLSLVRRNVRAFEASNPGASALRDFLGTVAIAALFGVAMIAAAAMFGE